MDISQLPAEMQQRIIKIQSAEGDNFDIDAEIVNACNTIKNLLRGPGKRVFRNALGGLFSIEDGRAILKKEGRVLASLIKETNEEVIISLHDVKSSTLGLVLDFCRFHNSQTLSEKETKNWNAEFVRVDQNVLCELASASYYLDIKPLVNLTSRAIATQVSGKSSEEIRETFHSINSDLYSPHFATRHRLQKKMNRKSKQETPTLPSAPKEDDRSVDELLSFINSNPSSPKSKKKKQKKPEEEVKQPKPVESVTPPKQNEQPKKPAEPKTEIQPVEKCQPSVPPSTQEKGSLSQQLDPALLAKLQQLQIRDELLFLERVMEMDPMSHEFDEMFEEEEKNIDPMFKAKVDREVEEWSRKLEQIYDRKNNTPELIF